MPDTDDTRTLPEIAADMSAIAYAEPWYGVYERPAPNDPLAGVDMLVAIVRGNGMIVDWLAAHRTDRYYVIPGFVDEMPAYRVPGECERGSGM